MLAGVSYGVLIVLVLIIGVPCLRYSDVLGLVQWEMLREVLRKINRVFLKHRCLFL